MSPKVTIVDHVLYISLCRMMDRGDRDDLNFEADKENIPVDDGRGEKAGSRHLQHFYTKVHSVHSQNQTGHLKNANIIRP
jgi:hypothetical protein